MTNEEAIKVLLTESVEISGNVAIVARFLAALKMSVNALTEQQNVTDTDVGKNDPLTLDELRQMDGEPVWVNHYNGGEWVTVHWNRYDHISTSFKAVLRSEEYGGRWLAYRQKPEEENHEA